MAEAASKFKAKQGEVETLTDTYKIRGTLFVAEAAHQRAGRIAGADGADSLKFESTAVTQ